MTVGPWQPISLHTYEIRISEVYIKSTVSEDLAVNVDVDFSLSEAYPVIASVILKNPDGAAVVGYDNITTAEGRAVVNFKFAKGEIDLWYPVGYGNQPIYTVEIDIDYGVRAFNSILPILVRSGEINWSPYGSFLPRSLSNCSKDV